MTRALRMLAALVAALATTLTALVALGTGAAQAADPTKTFAAEGARPRSVAVDSANHRAYVSNADSGTVSVVDTTTDTVLTTIAIPGTSPRPFGVAVNPTTRTLFVANANGTVTVVNAATNTVVQTVAVAAGAGSVAINTVDNTAWVTLGSAKSVVKLTKTGSTWAVAQTVSLPSSSAPYGVGIDPTAVSSTVGKVFVASAGQDRVAYVINTDSTGGYATTTAPGSFSYSYGVDVDPIGHRAYIAVQNPNIVRILDTRTNAEVGRIGTVEPLEVSVDRIAKQVYVVRRNAGNVSVYDLDTGDLADDYDFTDVNAGRGAGIGDVAVDPATHSGYVANPQNDTISVIRPRTPSLQAQDVRFTTTPPTNPVIGTAYTVTAVGGGSGNPVVLALAAGSTGCSLGSILTSAGTTSGKITFSRYGTCLVNATQAAAPGYDAGSAQQSIVLPARTQEISFTTTPPATPVAGDRYVMSASSTSGLPVTLTYDSSSQAGVCTVTGSASSGTLNVTFVKPGRCVFNANQAGNNVYGPAAQVQQVIVVSRAQVITFTSTPPADPEIDDTYVVKATGGRSGNPVVLARTAASSGVCTLGTTTATSGVYSATVTFTGRGTCTVTADQAGNTTYDAAAQQQQQIQVGGTAAPASITFTTDAPADATIGGTYDVAVQGSGSSAPVVLSVDASSTAGACTVDDHGDGTATVAFTGAGTCVVAADQAGDSSYQAAHATQSVEVAKKAQHVELTSSAPDPGLVGGTYTPTTNGGGASGNPVTIFVAFSDGVCSATDGVVTFEGPGTCHVYADQQGNDEYSGSQTQQSVTVKRPQTVAFATSAPDPGVVGGTYAPTATGGDSGSPVTFFVAFSDGVCSAQDGIVTFEGPGTCHVYADQQGNDEYAGAQVQQEITVKRPQTVAFTSTPHKVKAGTTYDVAATGGDSGQPVAFSVDPSSVTTATDVQGPPCSVVDHGDGTATVTAVAIGTCVVRAAQEGDDDYVAASDLQSVTVIRGSQKITYTTRSPKNALIGETYEVAATGGGTGKTVKFSATDDDTRNGICTVQDRLDGTALVTFTGYGRCVINAWQNGSQSYMQAPLTRQVVVIKVPRTPKHPR